MTNNNQVNIDVAHEIAKKYYQDGNLTLADLTYQDILKVVPDDFISLNQLGVIAYHRGSYEDGCKYLSHALDVNDTNPDSWNALAIMLAQLGRYPEAIQKWEKAIKIKPDFADAYSNMGNAYWKMGELKKSQTACEKAVEIMPELSDAYVNLGNALTAQGKDEEAIETWKKAIEVNPEQHNSYVNIGNSLRNLGRIKESEEYCRKGLEVAPENPEAHLNLGNALRDLGKKEEAEELYRKATELRPDFAEAHNNLSIVLMDLLRFDEAITAAKYAIAFDPNHVLAHANLSVALRETGKLSEAEASARKALSINPNSAEAKIDLADILFLSDRYNEAEALFNQAIEEISDSPHLYIKLSAVLERANRIEEAIDSINKALEINNEMPELHHRKAQIYFMANQTGQAIESINKAIELRPKFAAAYGTKSEILQSHGDMEGAKEAINRGLEIDNDLPFLYLSLSNIGKYEKCDPKIKKMESLLSKSKKIGRAQQIALEFALFKAKNDFGDYNEAFQHLKNGNDLKRANVAFDMDGYSKSFVNIKKTCGKEAIENLNGFGTESDVPIFILGMPRSGTTLTEQIISSHPDVFGAGELHYLTQAEEELGTLNKDNCKAMGDRYIELARSIDEDSKTARKITDKMPGNFSRLAQIVTTMPNAKIIHCRRNPMDTCLSCYKQLFARGHYWTYDLKELGESYKLYEDLMQHWRDVLPAGTFLEIDYETTVNDFENQARMLLDFVEMPWDDACLTPHKTKRSVLTASKGQVRKPIYTTSIEAWKKYEKQLEPLAEILMPNG